MSVEVHMTFLSHHFANKQRLLLILAHLQPDAEIRPAPYKTEIRHVYLILSALTTSLDYWKQLNIQ